MKKKLLIFGYLYIFSQFFLHKTIIYNSIFQSYEIFIKLIVPNLFLAMIISDQLINNGFIDICHNFFYKLFRLNGIYSFIFIMSILTGFPSSSKYIKDLLSEHLIDEKSANKLIMFTHFSNPFFILGTISYLFNYSIATKVLLSHYLGNIILCIIFGKNITYISNPLMNRKTFSDSIKNSIDTLLLIFGSLTFFLILSTIIKTNFHFSSILNTLLSGILEITHGIKYLAILNINGKLKTIIITFFLSFGGLSVHAQVLSIINNTKIKYKNFLIARLFHSLLSSLIALII